MTLNSGMNTSLIFLMIILIELNIPVRCTSSILFYPDATTTTNITLLCSYKYYAALQLEILRCAAPPAFFTF